MQFIINKFEKLYEKSEKLVNKDYKDKKNIIYEKILINTVFVSIFYKKGFDVYSILKDSKYSNSCSFYAFQESKIDDFFTAFDFVNNFIKNSIINDEMIHETLKLYNKTNRDFLESNDPYKKIEYYWELEDKEISENLNGIYKKLTENKYNVELFPKILAKISRIKNMDYENDLIDNIVSEMKRYIEEKEIHYLDFHILEENKEVLKIYNNFRDDLMKKIENSKIISNDNTIQNIMDSNDWGVNLYNYISSINIDSSLYERFFQKIDISLLYIKIKESNSLNIYNFKYLLDKIYRYNSVKNDYLKLFNLYELIVNDKFNIIGVSKNYAIICLLEKIENLLGKGIIMNKKIKVNKAKCKSCNDVIESKNENDFKRCKCGLIAVDGGKNYIKRIGNQEYIEELSEYLEVDVENKS